jgi:hypothetical protein
MAIKFIQHNGETGETKEVPSNVIPPIPVTTASDGLAIAAARLLEKGVAPDQIGAALQEQAAEVPTAKPDTLALQSRYARAALLLSGVPPAHIRQINDQTAFDAAALTVTPMLSFNEWMIALGEAD